MQKQNKKLSKKVLNSKIKVTRQAKTCTKKNIFRMSFSINFIFIYIQNNNNKKHENKVTKKN